MGIDLYYSKASAPSRAVLMVGRELGIEFTLHVVDLRGGEQMKPEFLAMNPQHTVPTIVDDGFTLWESRAILQYLCNKQPGDLYPTEPKKRAIVDRLLQFDLGTLYKSLADYYYPQFFMKQPADDEKLKTFKQSLTLLNEFLKGSKYVAGDSKSIADLSLLSSLTFAEILGDFNYSEWPELSQWLSKLKTELPYYEEINEKPLKAFKDALSG